MPNDIVLPEDDLAVSRIHFRIIYQDGFSGGSLKEYPGPSKYRRLIPRQYFEFFKLFSDKHMSRTNQVYLPKEIRMLIISYLRKPRRFYIQDMGSIHGTFVKMNRQPRRIYGGQTY